MSSMVSAPDVITYIGVPLAVLGVLPILYNTVATLATLQKVRRILNHGRLTAITRGDIINHVIEIELARYTIAPLDRSEQFKDYWKLSDYPSSIQGGTWTIFNWRVNVTGMKTQRIDYSDQLRQPQAEIEFEELVSYLLDLGAIPDPAGFRMLRTSGLWVPTGTPLLLSHRHEPALTIAPLDDSEGKLSLAVRWHSDWTTRDQHSLPPYWVLVEGLQTLEYEPVKEQYPTAIRCQIGIDGLIEAIPDDSDPQMFDNLNITHLKALGGSDNTGVWFASAITALGTSSQTVLWNYKIPSTILSFSKHHATFPCGLLVLLNVVDEASTPEWATKYDDEVERREAQFKRMREQGKAIIKEQQLSPDQRAQAVRERQLKAHDDWVEELNITRRRDAQRAETRMVEALQSPKWDNRLVAQHNLTWLKSQGYVEHSHDLKRATEVLLWKMINDPDIAGRLATMLDGWKSWVDNGGIKKADFVIVKDNQLTFAYASLVLALIQDSAIAAHGSLTEDLQECMRMWKKIRLG